jgi:hypothetical protein
MEKEYYTFNMSDTDNELNFVIKVNELKKENSNKSIKIYIGKDSYIFKIKDIKNAEYKVGKVDYQISQQINNLIKRMGKYDPKN